MYLVTLLNKSSETEVNLCLGLLEDNFGNGLEYYRWKHNINGNYDIEEYTFCIFKDDLCIATTQVIINEISISGTIYRFGLLCDGATHKAYRRLGLFEKLLSHINTFCSEKDVAFVYSTGNDKSRKALLKLGFNDFFETYKATKRVRYNHSALKIYNLLFNTLGKLSTKPNSNIKEIDFSEYANFFANQKTKYSIAFEKSEAYLKWRLAETTGGYKIFGAFDEGKILQAVLVLKNSKTGFFIMDVMYIEDVKYINQLLKHTSRLAVLNKNIVKINSIHNDFKDIKGSFEANSYKITKSNTCTLLYVLDPDFKIPTTELTDMHYMRIDKNE